MGKTHRLADNQGTLAFLARHKSGKLWKKFTGKLALITVIDAKSEERTPRMINAHESGLSD